MTLKELQTRQLRLAESMVNRTVKAVDYYDGNRIIIAFTDGCFIILQGEEGHDGDSPHVRIMPHITYMSLNLIDVGLITADELKAYQVQEAAEQAAKWEERERTMLAQLKLKYEPTV